MSQPRIEPLQQRVEAALARCLPGDDCPPRRLHEAMRYALLGGGKRVRPVLVYASGAAMGHRLEQPLNAESAALDAAACAVECLHVYSLVHDDLPAMDDDDLRRGKPTVHKAYDEATAVLVGDGLHALAFELLAGADVTAAHALAMVRTLARAGGSLGMVGGQAIDLAAVGHALSLAEVEDMHQRKTGALISAAVQLGALSVAPCADTTLDAARRTALDRYAHCIGLAFQIRDDVLDVEGDTKVLGKMQGADEARGKPTYPALLGLAGAKRRAAELRDEALACLKDWGPQADLLRTLTDYIVARIR